MLMFAAAPMPRSPPEHPDPAGRHRLHAEVQMMSREIGFLEEELKALEGIESALGCCKEVNEYVGANPDPIVPANEVRGESCCIVRWLRAFLCLNFWCICCSNGSTASSTGKRGQEKKSNPCCSSCGRPFRSNCRRGVVKCCQQLGNLGNIHCIEFSCGCVWSCSKRTERRICCPRCTKACCISQCIC